MNQAKILYVVKWQDSSGCARTQELANLDFLKDWLARAKKQEQKVLTVFERTIIDSELNPETLEKL